VSVHRTVKSVHCPGHRATAEVGPATWSNQRVKPGEPVIASIDIPPDISPSVAARRRCRTSRRRHEIAIAAWANAPEEVGGE